MKRLKYPDRYITFREDGDKIRFMRASTNNISLLSQILTMPCNSFNYEAFLLEDCFYCDNCDEFLKAIKIIK